MDVSTELSSPALPRGECCSSETKYLVVTADDFGLSSGVNAGILHAHRHGIVTSASLMVRQQAAEQAVEQARDCPDLCLGLHLDLGEWSYQHHQWIARYERVPMDNANALQQEVLAQLDLFCSLVGRWPAHVDSHQHVHRDEPLRTIVADIFRQRRIPIRHLWPHVRYCGGFYGQTGKGAPMPQEISVDNLLHLLSEVSPGWTELGCHPGFADDLSSTYAAERRHEVTALCDPVVLAAIEANSIRLTSLAARLEHL